MLITWKTRLLGLGIENWELRIKKWEEFTETDQLPTQFHVVCTQTDATLSNLMSVLSGEFTKLPP